jgi:hypothetical protein
MPIVDYPFLRPHPNARYAQVCGRGSVAQLGRYLPSNYGLELSWEADGKIHAVIAGVDDAGWTLDGYVLPRLASGLWWGEEISAATARGIIGGAK